MKKAAALMTLAMICFRLFALAGGAELIMDNLLHIPEGYAAEAMAEHNYPAESGVWELTESKGGPALTETSPLPVPAVSEISERKVSDNTQDDSSAEILPTTIRGGLAISNSTSFEPDISALLAEEIGIVLPAEGPQILVIHTHGSEAYAQEAFDKYEESGVSRTQDKKYSVIRVGDEFVSRLESFGLKVLHDRGIYDYPSYTGSYSRSQAAIESYLEQYPDIGIVIDLHRDALGTGDVIYKTVAEVEGETSSQIMLLVGTGENGLYHPDWQENLKLALTMQQVVDGRYSTLARPVALKQERYNQHLTRGSLILEVGSNGNTLREAIRAVCLFADSIGETLASMVQQS